MEEIKVNEIEAYNKTTILGKLAALIKGATKALKYDINIRLFKEDNGNYMVVVNDMSISCDNEEQVISIVHRLLLNIEKKHQEGKIPVLSSKSNEVKFSMAILGQEAYRNPEIYRVKLEDLLICGQALEEKDVVAEELLRLATISTEYEGENVEAVDFNLQRKI